MTKEWLEEELAKSLVELDNQHNEIEALKDILWEVLPIDEEGDCITCQTQGLPIDWIHEGGALCFDHPVYDRARKVLELI